MLEARKSPRIGIPLAAQQLMQQCLLLRLRHCRVAGEALQGSAYRLRDQMVEQGHSGATLLIDWIRDEGSTQGAKSAPLQSPLDFAAMLGVNAKDFIVTHPWNLSRN